MENGLFPEMENEWQKEWKGMPEFVSERNKPYQKISISFETPEDVKRFAEITGIPITPRTDRGWYPPKKKGTPGYYISDKWNSDEE